MKDTPQIVNMDDRAQKVALLQHIQQLKGLYEVKLRPRRKTRTLEQNAYYFAAYVSPFTDWLRKEWGDPLLEPETAHEILKRAVLGVKELRNPKTGEVIEVPHDTRFMDTLEFTVYLEHAALWLAGWCEIDVLSADLFAETAPETLTKKRPTKKNRDNFVILS